MRRYRTIKVSPCSRLSCVIHLLRQVVLALRIVVHTLFVIAKDVLHKLPLYTGDVLIAWLALKMQVVASRIIGQLCLIYEATTCIGPSDALLLGEVRAPAVCLTTCSLSHVAMVKGFKVSIRPMVGSLHLRFTCMYGIKHSLPFGFVCDNFNACIAHCIDKLISDSLVMCERFALYFLCLAELLLILADQHLLRSRLVCQLIQAG